MLISEGHASHSFTLEAQYVKTLAFHLLDPEAILNQEQLQVTVNFNVSYQALDQPRSYEVSLSIQIKGTLETRVAYTLDLTYIGLAVIHDHVPQEHDLRLALTACPGYLFPFARSIVTQTITDAGLASLMIQPINFEEALSQHAQSEE
jgi:preprotein translocase subunit SecB